MTDEPTPPDEQAVHGNWLTLGRVWLSAMQLAFVFALYVLSAGPMYWPIYRAFHHGGSSLVAKLYLPLVWLAEKSDLFSNWLDWYVDLWIG